MSWLAEAHTEWHTAFGWDQTCPLDCGASEGYYAECYCGEGLDLDCQSTCGKAECIAAHAQALAQAEARKAAEAPNPWEGFDPPF